MLAPPPPIMEAACFMKSGLLIICCTIGLFIISAMLGGTPPGMQAIEGIMGCYTAVGAVFDSSLEAVT